MQNHTSTARSFLLRGTAGIAGGLLLLGVAGTAFADEQQGADDVDVNVQIAPLTTPGSLSMTVASDATALTENGSNSVARQFTGTLPTVTVTDTRDAADIPAGAGWYVLGTASDFTSSTGDTIGAENLGWAPNLIDGGDSGLVAEGDVVDTALDGGPDGVGLVDQELLAITNDSAGVAEEGSWTANAALTLKTPTTVDAGDYSSTLTLSLFE
ncbi:MULTISPECIES: hypothetical protein [unclassified Rathayibacter]|uniref:hypothetical protein n=1 Tax=unclassified Rathayibacter TaxID=2609250 RepID=UPI000F4C0938|nr:MULTISPECIES: hypothetical protein [unclassified Rathayibacter]MCJ1703822.1 hypothetical protein [Rathayibacter sp. VKM Ac-2926]ROP48158.1 hypothetical protein EDF45_3303 [Rathayibacter sp. PhB186]ROS48656.1 hypothetical protein EDF44_3289 [Rathayibacter sp. PhB185]